MINMQIQHGDVNNNVALRKDSGHVTFYFRIPLFPQIYRIKHLMSFDFVNMWIN